MTAPAGAASARGRFTSAAAEELRVAMTRQQVTGRELARRLHVSAQWVSLRTRGTVAMNTDDMEMVAGALGISLDALLADAMRRVANSTDVDGSSAVTDTYTPR
jgi:transcriptional regulator with XRE-family HTH domain